MRGEEGWIGDAAPALRGAARPAGQGLARRALPRRKPRPAAPARGHLDPRPPPRRARRLAGRAAPCRGRAGGRRRPAAAVGAAGGAGSARRRPLRRPAARRSQPRQPARLALFGWSQEELFDAAFGRERAALAASARRPAGRAARRACYAILAMADYATPHALLRDDPVGAARRAAQAARAARRRGARPDRGIAVERARVRERAPRPRCRPSSTGSRAATSRSSAILPRRSTRSG